MKNITTYVCGFSFLNNNLTKDPILNLKKKKILEQEVTFWPIRLRHFQKGVVKQGHFGHSA